MNKNYKNITNILTEYGIQTNNKKNAQTFFPVYMNSTIYNTSICELDLSVRSFNCLQRANIRTIGQLCDRIYKSSDLANIRNCGKTSSAEIMDSLFNFQYQLNKEQFIKDLIRMNHIYK